MKSKAKAPFFERKVPLLSLGKLRNLTQQIMKMRRKTAKLATCKAVVSLAETQAIAMKGRAGAVRMMVP